MDMLQTYQGYFQDNGRFMPYEREAASQIPTNVEVYVVVTGNKPQPLEKSKSQRQAEALDKMLSAFSLIENEPLDDEFDKIVNDRVNISRDINL